MKFKKLTAAAMAAAMLAAAAPLASVVNNAISVTANAESAGVQVGDFKVSYSSYGACFDLQTGKFDYPPFFLLEYVGANADKTVKLPTIDEITSAIEKEAPDMVSGEVPANIAVKYGNEYYHNVMGLAVRQEPGTDFIVNKDNGAIMVKDGATYTSDGKIMLTNSFEDTREEFSIPEGVVVIGYARFNNLKKLHLSSTVRYEITDEDVTAIPIMNNGDDLEEITVDKNNPYYTAKDGVLYTKDMSTLCVYPQAKKDKEYTVPSSVITFLRGSSPSGEVGLNPWGGGWFFNMNGRANKSLEKITFLNPYMDFYLKKDKDIGFYGNTLFNGLTNLKTISGYDNSTAEQFTNEEKITLAFESLGTFTILKDEATADATAKGFEVIGLPEKYKDCKLKVEIIESYESTENKRLVWDISLVDADGKAVDTSDFGAAVTVKLPVPSEWRGAYVYHINEDDTKTPMPSTFNEYDDENKFVVYTTRHFSEFAIGNTADDIPGTEVAPNPDADESNTSTPDEDNSSKPDEDNSSTPDTGSSNSTVTPGDTDKNSGSNSGNNFGNDQADTGIALAAAPVVIACAAVIAVSKKKK